jgi:hypothetical protein
LGQVNACHEIEKNDKVFGMIEHKRDENRVKACQLKRVKMMQVLKKAMFRIGWKRVAFHDESTSRCDPALDAKQERTIIEGQMVTVQDRERSGAGLHEPRVEVEVVDESTSERSSLVVDMRGSSTPFDYVASTYCLDRAVKCPEKAVGVHVCRAMLSRSHRGL